MIIWHASSAEFADEYEIDSLHSGFAWSADSKRIAVAGEYNYRIHILAVVRVGAAHRLHLQGIVEHSRGDGQKPDGPLCFGWTTNGTYFLTLYWNFRTLCRWKTDTLILDETITSEYPTSPPQLWKVGRYARLRTTIRHGWMFNIPAPGHYPSGAVQIWDVEKWKLFVPRPCDMHDDELQDAVMCSDQVIVLCQRSVVRISLSNGSSFRMPFFYPPRIVTEPRLSPNGRYALFQDGEQFTIRDISTGRTQFSMRTQSEDPLDWWTFSEDDAHVAWSDGKTLTVWSLSMKVFLIRRESLGRRILSGAFSPNNDMLTLGQTDGAVLFRPL